MVPSKPRRAPGALEAFLILGALNLALFGDVLLRGGSRVLSSPDTDLFLHFAAWRKFALEELAQGRFPLWNPHYLCGSPFLGNFESALLYPLHWVGLFLSLPQALNWALVSNVVLAGFLTFLWARHRGISFTGGVLAGTVFMWGGAFYLHLYAGHLPNMTVMAWAPLLFLSLDRAIEGKDHGWFYLGVFSVSMQVLGGHPQYVYFTAIMGFFYLLLLGKGRRRAALLKFFLLYAAAFLVTAAQLGPGLEAYLESARRIPMGLASASAFSFPPENILTLFLPDLLGGLTPGPYWGRWYLWEVSLFMGSVPFLLALLGARSDPRGFAGRLLALSGIAWVLALGAFTPLFHFLFEFIPGFQGMRGMCKFGFLTALFLAILAGQGWDRFWENEGSKRELLRWALGIGSLALAGKILLDRALDGPGAGFWGRWFASLPWLTKALAAMDPVPRAQYAMEAGRQTAGGLFVAGLTFLALALLVASRKVSWSFLRFVPVLAVLELFLFARTNRPSFEFQKLQARFDQVRLLYEKDPGDHRVLGSADAALAVGRDDIWEDEPMIPLRYGQFLCRTQGIPEDKLFFTAPLLTRFNKAFSLLRLKYLLSWEAGKMGVYQVPFTPLPRMFLVSDWEMVPGPAPALDHLLRPSFDPSREVLLEKPPVPLPEKGGAPGEVRWKDLTSDRIEVTADLPGARILLVTDNYAGGWRAEALADSARRAYSVMPGDHFLRAIPLAAGHHHFLLTYRPMGFEVGKWISILSCLLFGAMFLSWRARSRIG